MPEHWVYQDRFPIKGGAYSYRECEHCGERIYEYVYLLKDFSSGDTMYVDKQCSTKLT